MKVHFGSVPVLPPPLLLWKVKISTIQLHGVLSTVSQPLHGLFSNALSFNNPRRFLTILLVCVVFDAILSPSITLLDDLQGGNCCDRGGVFGDGGGGSSISVD